MPRIISDHMILANSKDKTGHKATKIFKRLPINISITDSPESIWTRDILEFRELLEVVKSGFLRMIKADNLDEIRKYDLEA